MKIESLTKEQEALIPIVRDEWTKIGLCTEPANRSEAERGVALAYQAAGLLPPKLIIWLDSPFAGTIGACLLTQVRDQVGAQVGAQVAAQVRAQVGAQVRTQVWDQVRTQVVYGQHDAGWLGQLAFFRRLGLECVNRLEGLSVVAKNAGWWWPFTDAVILTERPVSLTRNAAGQLHSLGDPAILYPDGWGVWMKDGVRVAEPNPLERMSVL
jgi:hypothetical protein